MTTDSAVIASPVGRLLIGEHSGKITRVSFTDAPLHPPETALLRLCASQLQEFFAGSRKAFDVPLYLEGTPFQRAVWQELLKIPCGETRSYGQIAAAIGMPGASRAVGRANRLNPVLIIVPCHRVIRADGTAGGYYGGESTKKILLELERRHKAEDRAEK